MSGKFWVAAFAALLSCASAAFAVPPLEAYGNLPSLGDVTISPDGQSLAYVKGKDDKRLVVVTNLATLQIAGAVDIGDHKLRALQWADDDHLIITVSKTEMPDELLGGPGEYFQALWYDVKTKSQHLFLENCKTESGFGINEDTLNVIAGAPQPRIMGGHAMAYFAGVFFQSNQGHRALFREDLTDGTCTMMSSLNDAYDSHAADWVIDEAGNVVGQEEFYEKEKLWKLKILRDGKTIKEIAIPAPIDLPGIEGISEDGNAIVLSVPQSQADNSYEQVSLKDGGESAWQRGAKQQGDVMASMRTGRVIGISYDTDKSEYDFFDPRGAMMWRIIKAAFQDAIDVDPVDWSEDFSKVVVHAFGTRYGNGYFLIDLAAHKATPIGDAYSGITDISPVKWITYKAADGMDIRAYLTLPMGRDPKNLPLVVLPHGGPFARDYSGFDWLSQAIASRGYVVLQPQFRGSYGFGHVLLEAGFGEFGKKMQTDLSDGVAALAAQGLVDPKRVCIVGASYGGYAAMAAATLQSGIYRCAVSYAGVSDLSAQLEHYGWPNNSEDNPNLRYWDRFLGVSGANDPKLDAISPIKHVDREAVPILLIHGLDDSTVPYKQSFDMVAALKAANKPVVFVTLDGEDHGLSRGKTRAQMLGETVKFLEANNPPN